MNAYSNPGYNSGTYGFGMGDYDGGLDESELDSKEFEKMLKNKKFDTKKYLDEFNKMLEGDDDEIYPEEF